MKNAFGIAVSRRKLSAAALSVAAFVVVQSASAATYYWDGADTSNANLDNVGQGGTATWDLSATRWYDGLATAASNVVWPNTATSDAVFGGTGGTVTIGYNGPIVGDFSVAPTSGDYIFHLSDNRTLTVSSFSGAGLPAALFRSNNTTSTRTLGISTTETPVLSAQLVDNGAAGILSLNKSGAGSLELTSTLSNYSGLTTVSAGTLILSGANSSGGVTQVNGGGKIVLNSATNGGLAGGTLTFSTGSGGTSTLEATNADREIANGVALSGNNGQWVIQGNQSVTVDGSITAPGNTFSVTNNIATGKHLNLDGGVLLSTNSGRVLVFNGSGDIVVNGVVSNAGQLQYAGSGTLKLTAANTYTGITTVTSGTLIVGSGASIASSASAINVEAAGTLAGAGTINRNVSISGTLSPGESAGVLTTNGNVTFTDSTATFAVELNGLAVGTGYDQMVVAGDVTLNDATLDLTLGGTLPTLAGGEVFYILDKTTAGDIGGIFNGLADDARIDALDGQKGVNWYITYDAIAGGGLDGGNDIAIYTVIPEPAALGVLASAFGLLGRRARRR